MIRIKCPNCGELNKEDAKFCCECGTSLITKKYCPQCGGEVETDSKFCSTCGQKL
ncbi:MAG: zinc ribbon domain-containing protein [Lachnospiraceae bacterium]